MKVFFQATIAALGFLVSGCGGSSNSIGPGPVPEHRTWSSISDTAQAETRTRTTTSDQSPRTISQATSLERKVIPSAKSCQGSTAVLFLVDKSGSTGDARTIQVFKLVAQNLVGSLPDGAQVSVIGFDASPFVVFPFAPLGKETRIEVRERIGRLQGIGGTVLVPALREGQKQFKGRAEDCKEVVILTDGLLRDADADLKTEIGKLTSQKIRVSFGILLSPLGRSDVNKFLGANPGFFVVEPDVDRFSKLVSEQGQKLRG